MRNVLATIGGLLIIYSVVPYLVDMVRKKSKPNVVSWFTWTMLTGIATAAAFASHENRTAILTLGSAISTGLVVLLGIKYGFAKFTWFDGLCQAGAVLGLVLWLVFNTPAIAIIAAVSIDFIAVLPTLKHSWLAPKEETWQTFLISSIAAALALISLTDYNVSSLTYPVYLFLADGVITTAIILSRKRKGLSLAR